MSHTPTAQRVGPYNVTLFKIQTDDRVEIAVTRLQPEQQTSDRPSGPVPVVLVHGTFCDRSFWISPKGIGLGPLLRDRGFDVWMVELRGHGRSPKDRHFRSWSAEDHLRFDLPAVQSLVSRESGRPAHWVGHSWGGTAIIGSPAEGCVELFDAVGSDDKRFVLLGKDGGFSKDYQHVEMIIGHNARAEVWPLIWDWLESRPS